MELSEMTWPKVAALSKDIPVVIPIPPGSNLLTLETGPDQSTLGITGFAKAGFVK